MPPQPPRRVSLSQHIQHVLCVNCGVVCVCVCDSWFLGGSEVCDFLGHDATTTTKLGTRRDRAPRFRELCGNRGADTGHKQFKDVPIRHFVWRRCDATNPIWRLLGAAAAALHTTTQHSTKFGVLGLAQHNLFGGRSFFAVFAVESTRRQLYTKKPVSHNVQFTHSSQQLRTQTSAMWYIMFACRCPCLLVPCSCGGLCTLARLSSRRTTSHGAADAARGKVKRMYFF